MYEKTYTKVWKQEHLEELPEQVPEAVKAEILDVIETLNRYYGEHREVDRDLGGYIAVFSERCRQADYEAFLNQYHLSGAEREYQEILAQDRHMAWIKELFLCGSDYSLVSIHPELLSI